jgi:hypothetical protein
MAEVYRPTESGETSQLFVQFVQMQQQQALFAMGKHPNTPPTAPPPNLGLAKAFVDQLCAVREKTRGNLSLEEQSLINSAISGLQAKYAEALEDS